MRRSRPILNGLIACAALGGIVRPVPAPADPVRDVLWAALKACVLAKKATGRSFPCLSVDLGTRERPGTAVLRAPGEASHSVLVPTDTVAGLESPGLRGPRGAAYWRAALAARHVVSDAVPAKGVTMRPEAVALAVNSAGGRSQDQLHIHLSCLRADVADTLRRQSRKVGATWAPMPALPGGRYFAMRVPAADAERFNPFAALTRLPGRPDLRRTSFAAVAAPPEDPEGGILVLAYRSGMAHAEELMDHACTAAAPAARR